jgi:hypothetical protein
MNEELTRQALEEMNRSELADLVASDPAKFAKLKLRTNMGRGEMANAIAEFLKLPGDAKPAAKEVKKQEEPVYRVIISSMGPHDEFDVTLSVQEEVVTIPRNVPMNIKERFFLVLKNASIETERHEEAYENGRPVVRRYKHSYQRFVWQAEKLG